VVLVSQAVERALSISISRRSGQATTAQGKEKSAIEKGMRLVLSVTDKDATYIATRRPLFRVIAVR